MSGPTALGKSNKAIARASRSARYIARRAPNLMSRLHDVGLNITWRSLDGYVVPFIVPASKR